MTKRPPVPPEQRPPKDPGQTYQDVKEKEPNEVQRKLHKDNIEQTGERANIRQNTTNQGYNQGR